MVINASHRDPFMPVDNNQSLSFLINNFLKFGIHRVVVTQNNQINGIISQSDVIRFLSQHPDAIKSVRIKTIQELGLAKGKVISVTTNDTLIKALTSILEHRVSGLAVVHDSDGRLINNLSASDFKGVTKSNFFELESPLYQIFSFVPNKLPPVTCTAEDHLGHVIEKFAKTGVHRIYVVNDRYQPVNVITLTDVLNAFGTSIHLPILAM